MRAVTILTGVVAVAAISGLANRSAVLPGLVLAASSPQQVAAASQVGLTDLLAIEDARAPLPEHLFALRAAASSTNVAVQRAAVRALGRLERRDLILELLPYLRARDTEVREEAATALALSFRGLPGPGGAVEGQLDAVVDALAMSPGAGAYRALGRLPYATLTQFRRAEEVLRNGIASSAPSLGALRGLESLARLNRKLLPFEDLTLDRLRAIASHRDRAYAVDLRRNAMAALVASMGADTTSLTTAIKDADAEVRRLAALSLAGAGSAIDGARRIDLIRDALADRSPMVRLEALKGWVRHGVSDDGCARVMAALGDASPHVFLYALDALGDNCKDDIVVTDRLTAESTSPPATGAWQRQAHALVSLAKRAPDRAAVAMVGFAPHRRWQVRMYAARAAAAMNDAATLASLASDTEDNVKEAALPALRRLMGAESDDAFVAALQRPDYQLLRTAARELKGTSSSLVLASALGAALAKVTAENKDTSRDTRIAIIERLGELGGADDARWLRPLLRDFDPMVAVAAADLLRRWTSEEVIVDPQPLPRLPLPDGGERGGGVEAEVTMESGRSFTLRFLSEQAALSVARFLRLARAGYYDGLTFHRVVANAFIQGGSPGANEYVGDRLYMRDEVGLEMHTRGSVGISTRGRDTGDAQIFINLVDNPFLEHQYTVFARVCGEGMETVDRIQEGDRIMHVRIESEERCR